MIPIPFHNRSVELSQFAIVVYWHPTGVPEISLPDYRGYRRCAPRPPANFCQPSGLPRRFSICPIAPYRRFLIGKAQIIPKTLEFCDDPQVTNLRYLPAPRLRQAGSKLQVCATGRAPITTRDGACAPHSTSTLKHAQNARLPSDNVPRFLAAQKKSANSP